MTTAILVFLVNPSVIALFSFYTQISSFVMVLTMPELLKSKHLTGQCSLRLNAVRGVQVVAVVEELPRPLALNVLPIKPQ